MAAKQQTVVVPSSGGATVLEKVVKWAIIAGIVYTVLQLGVPTVVAWLDPGGNGGLLDRLPRVVRNLGILAAGVGLILCLVKWTRDQGYAMVGWGVVAILSGILAPTVLAWVSANGPSGVGHFLSSLNGLQLR
jgi:hypothetical protein